ncbi:helix-turn-helix transcriptional regulator [Samsonia erythrinae]|uniref:Regulatory LuxR family protein n=1 Tax=Samsonia erythrinae TaxID=160434 RepID=A0A4R3VQU0_9GAMM|nr:LuxR C-terminal-related transcriptional regulator [Samsonia erythrinae]TCV06946.1 regulatory LuxR family protein [Samsonia erythrinae]
MSIEIFSRCPFTTAAFTRLEKTNNSNVPIAVVDIEHGIDMTLLAKIIADKHWNFVVILNNRHHAPVMVAKKVLLLSKYTPVITIKNVISAMSSFREIKGKAISLSPNEKIFFDYWLDGISIKTIAKNMAITHKTANNMKNNIYRKYGVKDLLTFLLIARISHMQSIVDAEYHKVIYLEKVA